MAELSRRALLKGIGAGAAGISAWAVLRLATGDESGPGCLFGVHAAPRGGETPQQAITSLEAKIGRRFGLDRQYYRWNDDFPSPYDRWTRDQGRMPLLSWIPRLGRGAFVPWAEIAVGDQDARIAEVADACRAFGSPIWLAFNHEPENETNVWGTEDEYVAAWRRVHEIFADRGADNVSWVWIMTAFSFRRARAGRWYPGDRYVDVIAADAYNFFGCRYRVPWVSFERLLTAFYDYGVELGKPMLVGEWGSIEDPDVPGRKAEWIREAAATLKGWPEMTAVCYFHAAPRCPWWVDSSSSSLRAFAEMGQDRYFRSRAG